jgi:ligand-binding sensor domain-containing protein
MKSLKILLLALLFFLLSDQGVCQYSLFRSFETKSGGQKFRLHAIETDKYNTLYCGTSHGLMIFDHFNFKPAFEHDSNAIADVQCLYTDNSGSIWTGFKNGKVGILSKGVFKWLVPDSLQPTAPVTSFSQDRFGTTYISTLGEGLYFYKDNKLNKLDETKGLSDNYCYKVLTLQDESICVATDQGINFISFDKNKYTIEVLNSEDGLPDNIVKDLVLDKNGKLWVALHEKGYCTLDPSTKKVNKPLSHTVWEYGQLNKILLLEDETWLATDVKGLFKLENSGKLLPIPEKESSLRGESITGMIKDMERNVWIATPSQLIRASGESWSKLEQPDDKFIKYIHCILVDKKGDAWFSPDQQLYRARKRDDGRYEYRKFIVTNPGKLTDIVTLHEDKNGMIWIGTLGEGVYLLDPETGEISRAGTEQMLLKGNILSIEENNGIIRIGGFEGIKSFLVKKKAGKKTYELTETETELLKPLNSNYIYSIHTDVKGSTWIGTDEKGLVCLSNGALEFPGPKAGLVTGSVLSIASDNKGQIWFGTQGSGIYTYNGTAFTNYSVNDGLSDPSPSSVTVDPHGNVIIVHSNGVDILNPASNTFIYYTQESGFPEINPDLNTVSTGPDGRIWIGTEKDIFIYNPPADSTWYQPGIQISSILLFLQQIPITDSMILGYDQNNITIEFNASWNTDPSRISYSYILESYSKSWLTTNDHSVSFPKLPPGNYKFRVRASLNKNFNNSSEAGITFTIKAPFWQHTWFRIFLSLCIVGVIWLIIRRRESRLRQEEKLEQEKIEFQFETLRSQVNPHFLFNSFNTLISVIEDDPKLATEYVEHLSNFFRNIIAYKDVELITVKEEISLLENYIYIQTRRYGESLNLVIHIEDRILKNRFIPPLTLQLLAENAIKHNSISHETPLRIELFIEADYLVIKNNVNPRFTRESSTGMGLQNIIHRYKILTGTPILVNENKHHFTVSVPLIEKP